LPDPGGLLLQLPHDPQDPHVPGVAVGAIVGTIVGPGGGGGGGGGGGKQQLDDTACIDVYPSSQTPPEQAIPLPKHPTSKYAMHWPSEFTKLVLVA